MRDPRLSPTTSASQLVAFSMCPRKYFLSYILQLDPEFRSTALILGTVVHAGVDWWFEERIAGRTPTFEALDKIVESDVMAQTLDDKSIRWKESSPDALEADAKRFLRVYLTECGDLPVKAVETAFTVPLVDPDTGVVVGRDLRGFFDLVLEDETVIEVKTSGKGWRADDLARHLQIGAYCYVANTLHAAPSPVNVHVIVKLKGTPRVEKYTLERGDAETRWWLHAAAAIEGAIASGHFPPAPSQLCNECEFQSACLKMTSAPAVVVDLPERTRRHLGIVA